MSEKPAATTQKAKTKQNTATNFEESIHALETLVTALEAGDLSLEESLSTFEKGIALTKECQQQLTLAEQKISLLTGEGDTMTTVDFERDN